jgi:hypothetical protein
MYINFPAFFCGKTVSGAETQISTMNVFKLQYTHLLIDGNSKAVGLFDCFIVPLWFGQPILATNK